MSRKINKDESPETQHVYGKFFSFFDVESPQGYVEAWFDNHPEPWNIDCHAFDINSSSIENIEVYFADMVYNTWLIKINCNNMRRSLTLSKLLYKTTSQMDITQILIEKKLFLFQDLRL